MNPDTLYSESQITLMVPDMDEAVRFYTEALGLRLKARYGKEFAVVEAPGLTIGLHPLAQDQSSRHILARDIEDETHNTTRFIVLTADKDPPRPPAGVDTVTSFTFRVRNLPAALYKALGGFATNGVNMTKLESYMENAPSPRPSSTPRSTVPPRTRRCSAPSRHGELPQISQSRFGVAERKMGARRKMHSH